MGEIILIRLEGEFDRTPDADQFGGWPLPERLCYAVEPFDGTGGFTTPEQANAAGFKIAKEWKKVSQSELSDAEIAKMSHVMRGAEYELVARG